jgi:hypothetical protein
METATERQVSYLLSLWAAIAHPTEETEAVRNGSRVLTKREASELIDNALQEKKSAPRTPRTAPAVTEGLYATSDGQTVLIHKVVLSARGNLYAKTLTPGGKRGKWTYAPGLIASLAPSDALTAELAAEYGKTAREGWDGSIRVFCACCGAELDNEESRARGIGPVCYRKYF